MTDAYRPSGFCPSCGYRMDAGVCPECGARVDRTSKRDPGAPGARMRRVLLRLTIVIAVVAPALLGARYAVYAWWPTEQVIAAARSGGVLSGLADHITGWRRAREYERGKRRDRRIKRELAKLGEHDWAGIYSYHDGRVLHTFAIAPESGFTEFGGDSRRRTLYNHGSVSSVTHGTIELRSSLTYPALQRRHTVDNKLIRVRWSERRYVVSPRNLAFLREDVDSRGFDMEYAVSFMLLRDGDGRFPLLGLPEVSEEYRGCFPQSIDCARIVSTQVAPADSGYEYFDKYIVTSTVDRGAARGVSEDSLLCGMFADMPTAMVVSISENSAVVRYEVFVDVGEEPILPKPGWQFAILTDEETSETE